MGEAILAKYGGGSGGSGKWIPKVVIINQNNYFTVPNAKGQQFAVRIFGGGGGGSLTAGSPCGGGGGGNMNNATLKLNEGEVIPIIIGNGGGNVTPMSGFPSNGETTSFGNYLSATGGEVGQW